MINRLKLWPQNTQRQIQTPRIEVHCVVLSFSYKLKGRFSSMQSSFASFTSGLPFYFSLFCSPQYYIKVVIICKTLNGLKLKRREEKPKGAENCKATNRYICIPFLLNLKRHRYSCRSGSSVLNKMKTTPEFSYRNAAHYFPGHYLPLAQGEFCYCRYSLQDYWHSHQIPNPTILQNLTD